MTSYTKHIAASRTPQSQPLFGQSQVENHAGGFVYAVDQWAQLDRFLIIGSEGGTYYVTERALTVENAKNVVECIKADGVEVVNRLLAVSLQGRAPKNDAALFVLALVLTYGDDGARRAAYTAIPQVARIGTHLFHLMSYLKDLRGFGRGLTTALSTWYDRSPLALAQQVTKYQQRDGWSHRDVVRVIHPANRLNLDPELVRIIGYAAGHPVDFSDFTSEAGAYLQAVEAVKTENDTVNAVKLITDFKLPREVLPTELLKSPEVWEALLPHMGITAMIRNLNVMTNVGLLAPFSEASKFISDKLVDTDTLKQARVHPISILMALRKYAGNERASVPVLQALNEAFYASFGFVTPTGKRRLLALDVSGSMGMSYASGSLTARELSAAFAMVAARTETEVVMVGFESSLTRLNISPTDSLDTVIRNISGMLFGATDCAQPMLWAAKEGLDFDSFEIYTDNETWYGQVHPSEALKQYRKARVSDARLVVHAMTASRFRIADPNDLGMLDVVGVDSATPEVVSNFIRG